MHHRTWPALLVLSALAMHGEATAALSLDELVDCRYAVESLLHEQRIWPDSNPGEKPAFAALVTRAEIARRVDTMLDRAAALQEHGFRNYDGEYLQAELDRIARSSRDRELLAELFALAGDGEHAALCIGLPDLVARDHAAFRRERPADEDATRRDKRAPMDARDVLLPDLRKVTSAPFDGVTDPPDARYGHTAVWTGAEMVVHGGSNVGARFSDGSRYFPATDSWVPLPLADSPLPRVHGLSVWTGLDVVVWGGASFNDGGTAFPSGGRYRPSNDIWGPVSTANAPTGRYYAVGVWSGTQVLVWGGIGDGNAVFETGAAYSPALNTWQPMPIAPAGNARYLALGVWTGSELLIWGGSNTSGAARGTGLRYVPGAPAPWSSMTASSPRSYHAGAWIGPPVSRMVTWGGFDGTELADGGIYDPADNSWLPMAGGGPTARYFHTAVVVGEEVLFWGGTHDSAVGLDDGARFRPATNTWAGAIQPVATPSGRLAHSAVSTGDTMIVWGGTGTPAGKPTNSGGVYTPATNSWRATRLPRTCEELPGNVVPNCGFEAGTPPPGWPTTAVSGTVFRGGLFAGARSSDPAPARFAGGISACFLLPPGQAHDFGVWLRHDGAEPTTCSVGLEVSVNANCSPRTPRDSPDVPTTKNRWTLLQGRAMTGPFEVYARMFYRCTTSSDGLAFTLSLDDAFVTPLPDAIFADGWEN
jgi:hypothetical protein